MADRGESSANEEASRVRKVFLGEDPGPSTGNGVADDYERWLRREEHKIWKKHVPMLYDVMMSHRLTSPSLTVEWLPSAEQPEGEDYVVQKLLLGTRTANQEPNHLMLAEVRLPAADSSDNGSVDDEQDNDIVDDDSRIQIVQKIGLNSEVNRARYMPQNPSMVAVKTADEEVYILDYMKHACLTPQGGPFNPELRLMGHTDKGFGLAWSKIKEGHLLSGANDAQICIWDINAAPENKSVKATLTYQVQKAVEDVDWHSKDGNLFGSVANDGYLLIWDLRSPSISTSAQSVRAHHRLATCMSFNPINEWLVITGSSDESETVKLFDLRKIEHPLCTFDFHKEPVYQVCWNPKYESVFACCHDRRISIWDSDRAGTEQTPEEAEEGPPELLFIHGGHLSKVSDFSWNPYEDLGIASVADDNTVQVWEVGSHVYDDGDDLPS